MNRPAQLHNPLGFVKPVSRIVLLVMLPSIIMQAQIIQPSMNQDANPELQRKIIYHDANPAGKLQNGSQGGHSISNVNRAGNGNSTPSRASSVADPNNFTATPATLSQIDLQWQKNASNNNVMIAYNTWGVQLPVDGTAYSVGDIIPGGGIVIYKDPNTTFSQTGLLQGNFYSFKAWSYNGTNTYSSGMDAFSVTCAPPVCRFTAGNLSPGITEVIQLMDNSNYLPTSWLWDISPATVIYTTGSNTSQYPQVQFTAMGQYTVTLNISNVWGSDTKSKTEYINVGPATYCTPSYSDGVSGGDYISLVQLGSINNASEAPADPYYTYNSNMSTDLIPGNDYTITLSPGTFIDGNFISVWIDYNHDLLFGPEEKLGVVNIAPKPATGTISFNVPSDALTGITRMRVREVWLGDSMDACSAYGYGETEDYNVNILAPYCIPSYDYGTLNGDYISLVQLGTIDNATGASVESPYYTYYNDMSTDLMPGNSYSITLSPGEFSQENWFYVWIDFNHNQVFESLEMVGSLYLAQAPASGTIDFTVPAEAAVGVTRMRIREINGLNFEDPCFTYLGGETEDYNVNMQNPYCIPTYVYGTVDGDYISLVQLGSINNVSNASNSPFYTYYNYMFANLMPGEPYSITLSAGTVNTDSYIAVWIDYNHNLLFEPIEKLGTIYVDGDPATGTIDFTLPVNAIQGNTRMRVREVLGVSNFDACSDYQWGETEDYNVNILPQYCIPTYSTVTSGGDYISLVQLGSINNATGASESPFYSYYSNMSTDIVPGNNYTITLSPGTYADHNNISVWIDYNHNSLFETDEFLGNLEIEATPATGILNFTVPANAVIGSTRMRVREVWNESNFDACSEYGFGETEDYNINITTSVQIHTLNLTVFPEGLWNGTGLNKAKSATGDQYPNDVADRITIELHNQANYADIVYTQTDIDLSTSGQASVIIPGGFPEAYYLTVKHRNSIETVSAVPVSFPAGTTNYNFTFSSGDAFGNNLKQIGGIYTLFGGDVNQDGSVDIADMTPVDNGASAFATGYLNTDVNGDGNVDTADMTIVDNNSSAFIGAITPQ